MRKNFYIWGALLGFLITLAVLIVLYLGGLLAGLPFLPYNLFDWMARILPGPVITFGIDQIVAVITRFNLGPTASTAKTAEQLIAIIQFIALGTLGGIILAWLESKASRFTSTVAFILVIILLGLGLLAQFTLGFSSGELLVSAVWTGVVLLAWMSALVYFIRRQLMVDQRADSTLSSRREFLRWASLGTAGVLAAATGLRFLGETSTQPIPQATTSAPPPDDLIIPDTSGPASSPPQEVLLNRIQPAPGTRPEITPIQDFYRIDINLVSPKVDRNTWTLVLDGLVERPLTLTLDEILSRPSLSQYATLSCISNPVAGDLIGTTLWTGVRFKDLLEEAGLQSDARALFITSADGFYETVTLEDAMDDRTLLVYAMEGQPLTVDHGFPLRIFIPNRYGMKQPKWIEKIEAVPEWLPGYWVDRGWSEEATMRTTSVIDTIATNQIDQTSQTVPIGGIAHAGARGISKVEIQIDEGEWVEAQLVAPPHSQLTWILWRYDWAVIPGDHRARVRAYDGTGTLQETEINDVHPDGATGIHSRNIMI